MLSVQEMKDLRKLLRDAVKTTIWEFAKAHGSSGLYIYDGTMSSVRFATVSDDGKSETCYDVTIKRLGTRRHF